MIEETLGELRDAISKAHEALKRDLSRLRTGRASAQLLESVRVDYYGTMTPLSQMANVNVPEARLLVVKPWDKSQVKVVEKAIVDAGLGLNPQSDGDFIRIPIPPLSEDRRKELVKLARKHNEECKVVIRKARHDAKDMLATIEADGGASQDEVDRAAKKVEEIVQEGTGKVDEIVAKREKDILEV